MFIANEFFDALPIHQFQRNVGTGEWCEVLVGLEHENRKNLCFTRSIGENLHTRLVLMLYLNGSNSYVLRNVRIFGNYNLPLHSVNNLFFALGWKNRNITFKIIVAQKSILVD